MYFKDSTTCVELMQKSLLNMLAFDLNNRGANRVINFYKWLERNPNLFLIPFYWVLVGSGFLYLYLFKDPERTFPNLHSFFSFSYEFCTYFWSPLVLYMPCAFFYLYFSAASTRKLILMQLMKMLKLYLVIWWDFPFLLFNKLLLEQRIKLTWFADSSNEDTSRN